MQLAILSDTHIPARASSIPDPFWDLIEASDYTIHAGDFETQEVYEELEQRAPELIAVHGNADPATMSLPAVNDITIESVTFVLTHGTLNPVEAAVFGNDGMVLREDDWLAAIADTARARTRTWDGEDIVGIGGHTHQVEDTTYEDVRLLNPGSATGADPAEQTTMMTATVDGDAIEVELHEA